MMRKQGRKVPPSSTAKIRSLANKLRTAFAEMDVPSTGKVDMNFILDCVLPNAIPDFNLQIVPDEDLGEDHAQTFPDRLQIKVKESVYLGADNGNGRDAFTLAHELGHLFLHRNVSSYARSNSQAGSQSEHKAYEDSEWQADCFAAEFLMPHAEVQKCKNVEEVMSLFGVSYHAAQVRFDIVNNRKK